MNWKSIPGYEGIYEVSDTGEVRSLDRTLADGRGWKGKILKQRLDPGGRPQVNLAKHGVTTTFFVHHLVLTSFVGPRPPGLVCCHFDGNPRNNNVNNLRWDTQKSNIADKFRHGTDHNIRKTHGPMGFPLKWPNLVPGKWEKLGRRECRATAMAKAYVQRVGGGVTHELVSHYYDLIMERHGDTPDPRS